MLRSIVAMLTYTRSTLMTSPLSKASYKFAVPGGLYAVNNNLIFYILSLIPPAVFQVLLNIRVSVAKMKKMNNTTHL